MNADPASSPKRPTPQQLAHLEATGAFTAAEALAVSSGDPKESEAALTELRARHAKARLDQAVASGNVSEDEAADLLRQVKSVGHVAGLRSRINKLSRQSRAKTDQG